MSYNDGTISRASGQATLGSATVALQTQTGGINPEMKTMKRMMGIPIKPYTVFSEHAIPLQAKPRPAREKQRATGGSTRLKTGVLRGTHFRPNSTPGSLSAPPSRNTHTPPDEDTDPARSKEPVLTGFELLSGSGGVQLPQDCLEVHLEGRGFRSAALNDLSYFSGLVYLNLNDNSLDLSDFCLLPRLIELHLSCNGIRHIPNFRQPLKALGKSSGTCQHPLLIPHLKFSTYRSIKLKRRASATCSCCPSCESWTFHVMGCTICPIWYGMIASRPL